MDFLKENYMVIIAGLGGVLALAGVVVKLTKTKKDDKVFSTINNLWEKLTGMIPGGKQ